jgi:hypothetical protein
VLGAVGAVGAAAAIYFLDPVFGARRRRVATDWLSAKVRNVLPAQPAPTGAQATTSAVDGGQVALAPETPVAPPLPQPTAVLVTELPATEVSWTTIPAAPALAVAEPPEGPDRPPRVVLPSRSRPRRLSVASLTGLAIAAALGAAGLSSWALLRDDHKGQAEASSQPAQQVAQAITLLADPAARRIPVRNSNGTMVFVVGAAGRAVLILHEPRPAPEGKTYQAWVIPPTGKAPIPAGVFGGREMAVPLRHKVPMGATVAVTLEDAGGVPAPTEQPKLVAKRG